MKTNLIPLQLILISLTLAGCSGKMRAVTSQSSSSSSSSIVDSSRTFVIEANASDNIGVTKVEFYVNNTLTCTVTAPPYKCPWNVPQGTGITYTLQTKAYDLKGNVGASTSVPVISR